MAPIIAKCADNLPMSLRPEQGRCQFTGRTHSNIRVNRWFRLWFEISGGWDFRLWDGNKRPEG